MLSLRGEQRQHGTTRGAKAKETSMRAEKAGEETHPSPLTGSLHNAPRSSRHRPLAQDLERVNLSSPTGNTQISPSIAKDFRKKLKGSLGIVQLTKR